MCLPLLAEDGSFEREGVKLYYSTMGTGKPVVLLSGGPGLTVTYMKPLADFLPANCQAVLFEQRGTGKSKVELSPATINLKNAVDDLDALRKHLKQERITLVGHSWGGMLAMAYASMYPNNVDRMVLIASGGMTLEFAGRFSDNLHSRLRPEEIELEKYWEEAAKRGVDPAKAAWEGLRAIGPAYFYDRTMSEAFFANGKPEDYNIAMANVMFADLAKSFDCRDGLKRLDRPVLILQGYQDPIGDKTAEDNHAQIKGSVLKYFNRCGHFPWLERPDEFREAFQAFLK